MWSARNMNEAYSSLLLELLQEGIVEDNERTGTKIYPMDGGHSFKLDLTDGLLPVPGNRKYFPQSAAAEVAWQFMGTKDPTFILKHAPSLWSKFIEDGELKTAYGYRWRSHFGRDQLLQAVWQLQTSPTNRQLYISAWDPASDGLGGWQPKNIPCPVGFSVSAIQGKLHMSVFIRSSDVFVGLPYDVMAYALTAAAIAASAELELGTLHVTLAHPHLYEVHLDAAISSAENVMHNIAVPLPTWTIQEILDEPDKYVEYVKQLSAKADWPAWNPRPEVIE